MVLAAAFSAFAVAAVPALVFLAVWTAVTVLRILFPERPVRFLRDRAAERQAARERGKAVGVGVREIREDLRAQTRERTRTLDHVGGSSGGVPEAWIEDLHRRRN